jgi:hypothetical protein
MTKTEINHIHSTDVILEQTTEVMRQYLNIKKENPDSILLYRLGDFYETFFEDAELLSRELQVTLTGRDAGKTYGRIPLAGIPCKSLDSYLEKNDLPDAIIIPGGMPGSTNLANCNKLLNLVEKAFDEEKLICAICAAPAVVLGKTKLLKDKDWTCYPGMENHAESYLSSFNSEARLVKSGNLITAKGPGVAEEFSMEIVKTLFDDSLKEKIKTASIQR